MSTELHPVASPDTQAAEQELGETTTLQDFQQIIDRYASDGTFDIAQAIAAFNEAEGSTAIEGLGTISTENRRDFYVALNETRATHMLAVKALRADNVAILDDYRE